MEKTLRLNPDCIEQFIANQQGPSERVFWAILLYAFAESDFTVDVKSLSECIGMDYLLTYNSIGWLLEQGFLIETNAPLDSQRAAQTRIESLSLLADSSEFKKREFLNLNTGLDELPCTVGANSTLGQSLSGVSLIQP